MKLKEEVINYYWNILIGIVVYSACNPTYYFIVENKVIINNITLLRILWYVIQKNISFIGLIFKIFKQLSEVISEIHLFIYIT